jgi:uncharacterized repeat protein (TIGR03803 family)
MKSLSLVFGLICLGSLPTRLSLGVEITTLHSFAGAPNDGADPLSPLLAGGDGSYFGTTPDGGINNQGTIFRMDESGNLRILYSFDGIHGRGPQAGLIKASDGNIYGTTYAGGSNDAGTIFRMDAHHNVTTLHSFSVAADGAELFAPLIEGSPGVFYGTCTSGGVYRFGTVFRIDNMGHFTKLHDFTGGTMEGAYPNMGGVVAGSDGAFYGMTSSGGTDNVGTVFRIDKFGNFTTLHRFDFSDEGGYPNSGLLLGSDGNFYSTTEANGPGGCGTVFRMDSSGNLSLLHSFSGNGGEGCIPYAGLIESYPGTFYGTTLAGGFFGWGTAFRIDNIGILTTLASFDPSNGDGGDPWAGFILSRDGALYGTAFSGGGANRGTIFRLYPDVVSVPRSTY